jgi:hypothetical protein
MSASGLTGGLVDVVMVISFSFGLLVLLCIDQCDDHIGQTWHALTVR